MNRFIMVYEYNGTDSECEWETFTDGSECLGYQWFAIVDTQGDKTDKPDGFHVAHGCFTHAPFMLELSQKD